jgi:hypothetical protein
VSIVNWRKGGDKGKKTLLTQVGHSVDAPWRIEELDHIGPTLSGKTDVRAAVSLKSNQKPKSVFVGQYPFNEGFLLSPEEAYELLRANPDHREVVFPYMIGRDLTMCGQPSRWIIDFGKQDQFEARKFPVAFERVQERVMPDVLAHAEREKAATGKGST